MRFTRWWNPSLPQTLGIAVMLLYFDAVFGLMATVGFGLGNSAYIFLAPLLNGDTVTESSLRNVTIVVTIAVLVASLAYGYAGLAISNGQQLGWRVGVAVAVGAVILPVAAGQLGFVVGSLYIITYVFNVALVALLLHPQSREYQKVWFDKPVRRR